MNSFFLHLRSVLVEKAMITFRNEIAAVGHVRVMELVKKRTVTFTVT